MFTEAIENQIVINRDADLSDMKIKAYIESAMREYAINIGESELKVMKESGTEEDLAYLTEEASNGAIDKIKKAVSAAIKAFKEFISRIKDRVVRLVTTADTKETMKKVEKKVKLNPFLAKKKVQVVDTRKPLKVISKYESIVDKHAAKVKSGNIKKNEVDVIRGIGSDFETEYKAAIMGTAAMMTVTVAGLIAMVNKDMESLPTGINKVDSETSAVLQALSDCKSISEETAAECQAATASIVSIRAKLGRAKSNELVDGLSNKIAVLKKAVGGAVKKAKDGDTVEPVIPKDKGFKFKGKSKKGKVAKESTDDLLGDIDHFADDDDIFGEFSEEDLYDEDSLFEESSEEILGFMDDDDEIFSENSDVDDENSIFGESTEDDEYDDVFGESQEDDDIFDESSDDLLGDIDHFADDDDMFGESSDDEDDIFGESSEDDEYDDVFGESQEDGDDDIFGESSEEDEEDDIFGESAGREYTADELLDSIDDII